MRFEIIGFYPSKLLHVKENTHLLNYIRGGNYMIMNDVYG